MVDQTEQTNPTKSPEDERQYRIAVLKNGIKAVLVSDPETEKGAVCMRVGIGSFSDPVDLPGTAHFLEHMLFLGTQKFPKEDFFENFLQENGGMSNAMTDNEDTKYFYDVHHTGLLPSLEKFASFFTCPLLRRESSKREINAIQSEFEMDLPHDSWRFHQLAAHISDPKTVLNRFSIGNLKTLVDEPLKKGIDVFEELKIFYNKFYSSHLMTLAVIGRENLDVLENSIRSHFSDIKKRSFSVQKNNLFPVDRKYLAKFVNFESVKKAENLFLKWPHPSYLKDYKTKSFYLVSHLIGHETKGSLFYELCDKKLANRLYCGPYTNCSDIFIFYVKIKLTEKGKDNIEEVILLLYKYIDMLKKMTIKQWQKVYEEVKIVEENSFVYQSKQKPINYARDLSENIAIYDKTDILTGPHLLDQFDFNKIKAFLDLMEPENMLCFYSSKNALKDKEDIKTEPNFSTKFSINDFKPKFLQKIKSLDTKSIFAPPIPNRFLPTNFDIINKNSQSPKNGVPIQIRKNRNLICYYKPDLKFRKPLVVVNFY